MLKRLRIAVSLLFFVGFLLVFLDPWLLLPAGFTEALTWPQFVPALNRLAGLGMAAAAGLVFVLVLTLLFGRVYCSGICPLGVWQDLVARLAARKRRPRYKARKGYPWLRGAVVAGVFGTAALYGSTLLGWMDPYSIFGRFLTYLVAPVVFFIGNLGIGTANLFGTHFATLPAPPWAWAGASLAAGLMVVVTGMAAFRGRLFCNTLCPVGGVLGFLSRYSLFRIQLDGGSCTACTRCHRSCKAECIDATTHTVDLSRCVACFNCLDSCPRGGIRYAPFWKKAGAKKRTEEATAPSASKASRRAFFGTVGFMIGGTLRSRAQGRGMGRGRGRGQGGGGWGKPPEEYPVHRPPLAPPGAGSTDRFTGLCTSCTLCVAACPTQVLQPSTLEYGLRGLFQPRMDFHAGSCTYECRRCLEVCPTGALQEFTLEKKKEVQLGVAEFYKHLCIVHEERTACGACAEHCPTGAVKMVAWRDGLTMPAIEPDICIGCGACEHACPTEPQRAILVRPHPVHEKARKPDSGPAVEAPVAPGEFPF